MWRRIGWRAWFTTDERCWRRNLQSLLPLERQPRRKIMKHLIISLSWAGSCIALSTLDASAVVCARGVYRAGCVAAGGAAVVARPVVRPAARAVVVGPRRGAVRRRVY